MILLKKDLLCYLSTRSGNIFLNTKYPFLVWSLFELVCATLVLVCLIQQIEGTGLQLSHMYVSQARLACINNRVIRKESMMYTTQQEWWYSLSLSFSSFILATLRPQSVESNCYPPTVRWNVPDLCARWRYFEISSQHATKKEREDNYLHTNAGLLNKSAISNLKKIKKWAKNLINMVSL